ncbi:MAG: tetratricopeptide repeat protein [Fibromonadaceae bacterium]|jgi:tol-pal system protein YbgF|nr:tetratricopeptide repeat protein [Fibromonadaceae bacterium]
MKIQKISLLSLPVCLFLGCASSAPEPVPAPTVEEVARVDAKANQALRLATEDSARVFSIIQYLEYMSKRIDLLDSISAMLPLAAANENLLHISLLREEVTFLRRFMENQNVVPLINPSRQQVPETPGPFPPEYEQAKYLFSQKNYEAASTQFEKVTVLYPRSNWAADAWYWSGESQMAQGNYTLAVSAFEKVFFFPESIKQADAQFQIGICLSRIGSTEYAKQAFRKVQEFYPKSPRALQAQAELNKLR